MDSADHVAEIRSLSGPGRRVVFVSGNFNIIHPGHLRLLRFASECGDFLVVGVNPDLHHATTVPLPMRVESVKAISFVSYAFPLNERPDAFIMRLQPSIVVKGKEFEGRDNPEQAAVDGYGGKLLFGSGEVRFSSMDLLQRELQEMNLSTIRKPTEFAERHHFDFDDLIRIVQRYNGMRVVVVGDLIVDEYINCDPLGMSHEDPTIVVTPIREDRFIGGAAIVAAHARGLGATVSYFGVAAQDDAGRFAAEALERYSVDAHLIGDESRPTTLKQRYRASGKTLLRVSRLRQHDISRELSDSLLEQICAAVDKADMLIFSDFNYGCLPQPLVDRLIEYCNAKKLMMAADSQASSQLADVSRFKGMRLLTPTEYEARLAVRDNNSGLVVLAEALRRRSEAHHILITLGAEGLLIHTPGPVENEPQTDQLPAFNSVPQDASGAGDSLLACASMALTVGADVWQAAYLGSVAAACQVSRVGNSPLTADELNTELRL